jgi:hypothetical protein
MAHNRDLEGILLASFAPSLGRKEIFILSFFAILRFLGLRKRVSPKNRKCFAIIAKPDNLFV